MRRTVPSRRARGGRGDVRLVPQRARDARSRSADPHVRRVEDLELPPVAARLRRARLRRDALAGLRRGSAPRAHSTTTPAAGAASAGDERHRSSRGSSSRRSASRPCSALVWVGGWWLLRARGGGGVLALHEYALMTRSLRPVILAGVCRHAAGAPRRASSAGSTGPSAGFMTHARVRVHPALASPRRASRRPSRSRRPSSARRGSAWASAHFILLRDIPGTGGSRRSRCCSRSAPATSAAFFAGRLIGRHKLAPALSPGKTWEGFVFGSIATVFVAVRRDLQAALPLDLRSRSSLGLVIAVAASARRPVRVGVKRDMQVEGLGAASSRRTAACSTGSTHRSSPSPAALLPARVALAVA